MVKYKCPVCRVMFDNPRGYKTCSRKCSYAMSIITRCSDTSKWIYISSKGIRYTYPSQTFIKAWIRDKKGLSVPGTWVYAPTEKGWKNKRNNVTLWDNRGKYKPAVEAAYAKLENPNNYDEDGNYIPSKKSYQTKLNNPNLWDENGYYIPLINANESRRDNPYYYIYKDIYYFGDKEFNEAWDKWCEGVDLHQYFKFIPSINCTESKRANPKNFLYRSSKGIDYECDSEVFKKAWRLDSEGKEVPGDWIYLPVVNANRIAHEKEDNWTSDGRYIPSIKHFDTMLRNGNGFWSSKQELRIIKWIRESGFKCGKSRKGFTYKINDKTHTYYPDIFIKVEGKILYIEAKIMHTYKVVNPQVVTDGKIKSMWYTHNKDIILLDECINVDYSNKFDLNIYYKYQSEQKLRLSENKTILKEYE